jgi:hypothetical protein
MAPASLAILLLAGSLSRTPLRWLERFGPPLAGFTADWELGRRAINSFPHPAPKVGDRLTNLSTLAARCTRDLMSTCAAALSFEATRRIACHAEPIRLSLGAMRRTSAVRSRENHPMPVIPAKAGIHPADFRKSAVHALDSRFRGNDQGLEWTVVVNSECRSSGCFKR